MKKYLIIAAAALLAAACAKTYEVKETTQGPTPISFGSWSETLTKARATADDNTAFQTGDVFDVYGFKGTNSVVFDGDDVTATVSGTSVTWDYTTHRFWDPAAASYTFFAVLPANQLAAEASANAYATTGLFTSNDISFDDPTNMSNDILVADKTVVVGSGSAGAYTYTNPVQINFNHAASCLDLKVKQDNTLGNAIVTITALSLVNIHNSGHFAVSAYAASSPYAPTIGWTENSTPATLGGGEYAVLTASEDSDDVTVTGKTTYTSNAAGTTDGTAADIFTGYVFMPQELTTSGSIPQQIKLSYTIQVGSETPNVYTNKIINLASFQTTDTDNNSGTAISSWDAGKKYIYTITIGASYIQFTASVNEWDATIINGYNYLVN